MGVDGGLRIFIKRSETVKNDAFGFRIHLFRPNFRTSSGFSRHVPSLTSPYILRVRRRFLNSCVI